MNKKNILFLLCDDLRYDTINALGNKEIITPNLDALVSRSVSFNNAHIPGGTSGAICLPSRAMINTGKSLFHLKDNGQSIPKEHVLLGEHLKNNGYQTFGVGKWHNAPDSYARSFTQGAEIFFGGMHDHWNVPACSFDPTGEYSNAINWINNPYYDNEKSTYICDHITPGKHSTKLFADTTIEFIDNYDNKDPFFAYVSFMAPHDPRSMPEEFLEKYSIDDISLPDNFAKEHIIDYGICDIRDEVLAPYPRTKEDTKKQILEYYAMITQIDFEVGRIIDSLKEKGLYEDTIIVFTSDNGLAVGQHGLFGKQNNYEHSIKLPLMISGPDIPKGQIRDKFVYLFDIFPTLCDLIDIEIPSSVEGKSFYKIIHSNDESIRDDLYFAYTDLIRSVKNKRYKLIHYLTETIDYIQLFDLKEDPNETKNLHGIEEYSQIESSLTNRMMEFKDKWDDENHPHGEIYWNRYRSYQK